jgi:hypothetical protein
MEEQTHVGENVGKTDSHALIVEPKSAHSRRLRLTSLVRRHPTPRNSHSRQPARAP